MPMFVLVLSHNFVYKKNCKPININSLRGYSAEFVSTVNKSLPLVTFRAKDMSGGVRGDMGGGGRGSVEGHYEAA